VNIVILLLLICSGNYYIATIIILYMKGQMEIIVVLGIIFVVVIVAFYAIQSGTILPEPIPKGVYEEQRDVANTIKNVVRDASSKTLRTMMAHGGYLEDKSVAGISYKDVSHTDFMLRGVAYWQQCDKVMYPDIRDVKSWMEVSIEKMVMEGMDDVEMLYGNRAEFDREGINVDVKILGQNQFEPDMLDITLTMPTKVRDYSLPGDLYPYNVKVDTQFGRIYAFGKDFADVSAQERFFDVFTITAIYFSQELEGTHSKLPTFGVLTQCGEVLFRSPQQINAYLLETLEYVMASTLWWQRMENLCPGETCLDETKAFAIPDLNGKTYPHLDIVTMVSDNWFFNIFDYVFVTNFEMLRNDGYTIPVCTEVYNKAYNFNYPFVVRVRDRYTGYYFNFASMVGVKDRGDSVMEPGDCRDPTETPSECKELTCSAKVRVVNDLDEPLPGAWVVFGDCPLGETDENGYVEGPIQCGLRELFIYQDIKYEFLKRSVSATNINNTYVLNMVQDVRIHFREVNITRQGYLFDPDDDIYTLHSCDACQKKACRFPATGEAIYECSVRLVDREYAFLEFDNGYMKLPVTNFDMSASDPECRDDPDCILCEQLTEELQEDPGNLEKAQQAKEACSKCIQGCATTPLESVVVNYLPVGYTYRVDARMHDPLVDFFEKGGFLDDNATLGRDDTELYVYIPRRSSDRDSTLDFQMEDSEKACLTEALKKCEMEPVSSEKYVSTTLVLSPSGCTCSYLKGLAEGCGAPRPNLFCECPSGGSFPGSCGKSCGGPFDDPCTTCCSKSAVLEHLKTLEESCSIRVICK
jgi:hypothetical protein